jgi:hypothetical protein
MLLRTIQGPRLMCSSTPVFPTPFVACELPHCPKWPEHRSPIFAHPPRRTENCDSKASSRRSEGQDRECAAKQHSSGGCGWKLEHNAKYVASCCIPRISDTLPCWQQFADIELELYTDESPGLKVDPVVVLVLSIVFIFSVVALHGKHSFVLVKRMSMDSLMRVAVIAKITRKFSS